MNLDWDRLQTDLRARAEYLIEVGRDTPSAQGTVVAPLSTLTGSLHAARTLANMTTALIEEATDTDAIDDQHYERTQISVGARAPRSPWAYEQHGDVWAPRHWLRPMLVARHDVPALNWLLGLILEVGAQLQEFEARLELQAAHIRAETGSFESVYQAQDLQHLNDYLRNFRRAALGLGQAEGQLRGRLGPQAVPASRPPSPFPTGHRWQLLSRTARLWRTPAGMPDHLQRLLGLPLEVVDLPYLYQRWAAVQVLDGLATLGHPARTPRDAAWALFMGGEIQLQTYNDTQISVWVEPRITSDPHPSGLQTTVSDECTPDLVLNVHRHGRVETTILDPTLRTRRDQLVEKSRYLTMLKRQEPRYIAGVAVQNGPRRAWSISPRTTQKCEVIDFVHGSQGIVPLMPGHGNQALMDFLRDVVGP